MEESRKVFEKFYLSRHTGRKLTWQPALGTADVRVAFKARKHDLNVSTFALVILLLFENKEDGETLSYEVRRHHGLRSGFVVTVLSCVGHQSRNEDRGARTQAKPAVFGMREVQDPEEAPTWT